MDPIIKALHETWKKIVTEEKYEIPKGGLKDPSDYVEPDGKGGYRPKREKEKDPFGNKLPTYDVGLEIGPDGKLRVAPKKPKPSPTPGKTPYDDRGGDAPQLTKTPYDVRGGSEDNVPTPTPKPKYPGLSIYDPVDGGKWKREQEAREAAKKAAKEGAVNIPKYEYDRDAGPGEYKTQPIISTRTSAQQPAVPATTGSGLLSIMPKTSKDVLSIIPKTTKNMFSSGLNLIPKIYEERDAEGQMAKGELMNLASKAQELANMMKDDTQLEAWVQSKITKAKDYISSVHDYMNGNPDKID